MDAFFIALALVVMTLLGYFLAALLCPPRFPGKLLWALAPGAGAGLCSLVYFFFRRPMFTVELVLLAVLAGLWVVYRRPYFSWWAARGAWQTPALCLLLAAAASSAIWGLMLRVERVPHGEWDGVAIWNSHARVMFRYGPDWESRIVHTNHPDYPLLIPAANARLWRYAAKEIPETGGILGILLGLSGAAVLLGALWEARDPAAGVLMGLVLLGSPAYLLSTSSQYADVPLAVFILSTAALVYLHHERAENHSRLLVLAGFLAGCAAWTKNEGLAFAAAAALIVLAKALRTRTEGLRNFANFAAGLALPLVGILVFKTTIAPTTPYISMNTAADVAAKLQDLPRYMTILDSMASTSLTFAGWALSPVIPLVLYMALRGVRYQTVRGYGWLAAAAMITLLAATYYTAYVITPYSLEWHLENSLERLMMHLWPSVLLLAGLALRPLDSEP